MMDLRLSDDDKTRWAAQRATKTRCQHCPETIYQPMPDGWWWDMEDGSPNCQAGVPAMRHRPLPTVGQ